MQWLIDIIVEVVRANFGYFHMPEKATYDFTLGDWSQGAGWQPIIFKTLVPDGARAVHFHIDASNSVANQQIRFRAGDVLLGFPVTGIRSTFAGWSVREDIIVPLDPSLTADYNIQGNTWTKISASIVGYWL